MKHVAVSPVTLRLTTIFAVFLYLEITLLMNAGTGLLRVHVTGADNNLIPCRAWVNQNGTRHFRPLKPATATPYARDESFSCDGWFEMSLEEGMASVHIEKGKEWLPSKDPRPEGGALVWRL